MMNRRRLLWLCAASLLIVVGIAAWLLFANRDADFHVIGPKTRGVRANLAMLDSKIDVADFHDCRTLGETWSRLSRKVRKTDGPEVVLIPRFPFSLDTTVFAEGGANHRSPVHFSGESRPLTVKQFLRDAFRQAGVNDVHFIVRGYGVEATTLERVQDERSRYLDSVSLFDRVRNAWKELTGQVEYDELTQGDVK